MKKSAIYCLIYIILLTFLPLQAALAQAHSTVHGRILPVLNQSNTLIVKLQIKGEDLDEPAKILMLTNATLWFSFEDSLVSLAETPLQASSTDLADGEYIFPSLYSPGFTRYNVTHQTQYDAQSGSILHYAKPHIVWEKWDQNFNTLDKSDTINQWKDLVYVKFDIIQSGKLHLKWNTSAMMTEIIDINEQPYDIGIFDDLIIDVVYEQPVLQLISTGEGTTSNPLDVYIKSTDNVVREAGTAGFYIYYSSYDATFNSALDKLNDSNTFGWNTATITVDSITPVFKDMIQYDRRIKYVSNDGTQSNDFWPIASSAGINAVEVTFKDLSMGEISTYLEVINQEAFKNHEETTIYPTIVKNLNAFDPLPVTLISFTATLESKEKVNLKWTTSSEKNNDKFIVERSANGTEFVAIATVKGNGTTNSTHTYSTIDAQPLPGMSYYRLKQIDFSGEFEYSRVIAINNTEGLTISSIYPNPFQDQMTLALSLATDEIITLTVNDLVGKVLKTIEIQGKAGANTYSIQDLSNLKHGIYFINITNGTQKATYKLLKTE